MPISSAMGSSKGRRGFLAGAAGACAILPAVSSAQVGTAGRALSKEERDRMTPSR
jgi:hypothetical protein